VLKDLGGQMDYGSYNLHWMHGDEKGSFVQMFEILGVSESITMFVRAFSPRTIIER
jgi:hypothetical protein